MKSFIAALVAVVALTGSAFAGHCGVQQVQKVVVGHGHHAQQVVQFVEVPQLVVVRQQQVYAPQRVVEFVEVQKVQKVQRVQKVQQVQKVQKIVVDNGRQANIKVEINQGRRGFLNRGR